MKKRIQLGVALLVALTLASATYFGTSKPEGGEAEGESASAPSILKEPLKTIENSIKKFAAEKTEVPPTRGLSAPDNIYKEVFARNPELLASLKLKSVVIKDADYESKKRELFTNKEYLDRSFRGLEKLFVSDFDLDAQLERMYKVDFIKMAASIKDNPHRDFVFTQMTQLATNLPEGYAELSMENKQSMMGDRIELYYSMLKYYPERIEEFNRQLNNPKLKGAFLYAKRHVEELAQIDLEHL